MGFITNSWTNDNTTDAEVISHIREYLSVLSTEPAEHLLKVKDVYHQLRRMIGDE